MPVDLRFTYKNVYFPHNPVSGEPWQSQQDVDDFIAAMEAQAAAMEPQAQALPAREALEFREATPGHFLRLFTNTQLVAAQDSTDVDVRGFFIRLPSATPLTPSNPFVLGAFAKFKALSLGGFDDENEMAILEIWPRQGEEWDFTRTYVQVSALAETLRA